MQWLLYLLLDVAVMLPLLQVVVVVAAVLFCVLKLTMKMMLLRQFSKVQSLYVQLHDVSEIF